MKQGFIVERTTKEAIEDYYSRTEAVAICLSEEAGKVICERLAKEDQIVESAFASYVAIMEVWEKEHPIPTVPYPKLVALRKLPPGVTKDMLNPEFVKERERIKADNERMKNEYADGMEKIAEPYLEMKDAYEESVLKDIISTNLNIRNSPEVTERVTEMIEHYPTFHLPKVKTYKVTPLPILEA